MVRRHRDKTLFRGTFGKIGVPYLNWRNDASVTAKTPQQRQQMIDDTDTRVSALAAPRSR